MSQGAGDFEQFQNLRFGPGLQLNAQKSEFLGSATADMVGEHDFEILGTEIWPVIWPEFRTSHLSRPRELGLDP